MARLRAPAHRAHRTSRCTAPARRATAGVACPGTPAPDLPGRADRRPQRGADPADRRQRRRRDRRPVPRGSCPADALAYIHVSTDPGRASVGRALAIAARFPDYQLLAAAVTGAPWRDRRTCRRARLRARHPAVARQRCGACAAEHAGVEHRAAARALGREAVAGARRSWRAAAPATPAIPRRSAARISSGSTLALVHGYLVVGCGFGGAGGDRRRARLTRLAGREPRLPACRHRGARRPRRGRAICPRSACGGCWSAAGGALGALGTSLVQPGARRGRRSRSRRRAAALASTSTARSSPPPRGCTPPARSRSRRRCRA